MDAPRKLTPSPPWAFFTDTTPTVLGWRNGDNADQFELQIRRNNYWPGSSPIKWVDASGNLSATIVTPTNTAIDQTVTINAGQLPIVDGDGYKWRVRSRAAATSTWSAWSNYSRLYPTIGAGSVTILDPGTSVSSNHTRVVFRYDTGYSPGYTSSFRVRQYLSGQTVFDSGEVSARIYSGSTYSYLVEDYTNLNNTNYTIGVSVRWALGSWESEVTKSFLATPTGLASPRLTAVSRADGRVIVTCDAATVGKTPYRLRLYRYNPTTLLRSLVSEWYDSSFTYTDSSAPLNTTYRYEVEVVATDGTTQSFSTGDLVINDPDWYIVFQGTRTKIVVEEFGAEHPARTEYLEPLGRSRSIAFKLETEGREGTISFHVLSSERTALLAFIYNAVASDENSYIVSPHGDVLRVTFRSPEVTDGVGGDCTVTMQYVEVAQS